MCVATDNDSSLSIGLRLRGDGRIVVSNTPRVISNRCIELARREGGDNDRSLSTPQRSFPQAVDNL